MPFRLAAPVQRIVSGGQTGVDRAALDVALDHEIPVGGWCPKGRTAEDGPLHGRYPLTETPASEYAERTEWNVRDSDGTLVITWGPPADGTAYTLAMARKHNKPAFVIDLAKGADGSGFAEWLNEHHVETLNVAGPRASKHPEIYRAAYDFLIDALDAEGTV